MIARRVLRLLALPGAAVLSSCASNEIVGCDASFDAGILLRALDASTGGVVTDAAVAVARDGQFVDTLEYGRFAGWPDLPAGEAILAGVPERPGVYALRVTAPGYRTWDAAGVRVARQGCSVVQTRVVARMQPLAR